MLNLTRIDFQSAVSRIDNPQTVQPFNPTLASPVANRRHGRLAICATGQDLDKAGVRLFNRVVAMRFTAHFKSRRRRKESLIKTLLSRKFETPYVVSYGNELFFNSLLRLQDDRSGIGFVQKINSNFCLGSEHVN